MEIQIKIDKISTIVKQIEENKLIIDQNITKSYFENKNRELKQPIYTTNVINNQFNNYPINMFGYQMGWNPLNYGWINLYSPNNQYFSNSNNIINPQKINVVFRTINSVITNILIDNDKTLSELILIYFKRINSKELFDKPSDIIFIHNAKKIDYNDKISVKEYFKIPNPNIIVQDVRGLIGAI